MRARFLSFMLGLWGIAVVLLLLFPFKPESAAVPTGPPQPPNWGGWVAIGLFLVAPVLSAVVTSGGRQTRSFREELLYWFPVVLVTAFLLALVGFWGNAFLFNGQRV